MDDQMMIEIVERARCAVFKAPFLLTQRLLPLIVDGGRIEVSAGQSL